MRRWIWIAAVGCVLVGCTQGQSTPAEPGVPLAETEVSSSPASGPAQRPPKTDAAAAGSETRPRRTRADVDLVRKFVRFSLRPQERPFRRFSTSVELGLGEELVAVRAAEQLHSDRGWMLGTDDTIFRGAAGPFSPVETVRQHLEFARSEGVRASDAYTVTVGPHRRCASPPAPPPESVRHLRRVALVPSAETIKGVGCLRWFSVDFFVDDVGEVRAITLDLWEP